MPILAMQGVTHLYNEGMPSESKAIDNINLEIEEGELVGVIGHTGSGKSTLVQHFNGILKPNSGKVIVDGVDIWSDKKTTREARFKVGLCFQYPEYQLFEETVYKDISFGPKNMNLSDEEIAKRVVSAAAYVGLKRELLEKSPFDLSGGEKVRLALCKIFKKKPNVLILDEPTNHLDVKAKKALREALMNYEGALILVTHEPDFAEGLCDIIFDAKAK